MKRLTITIKKTTINNEEHVGVFNDGGLDRAYPIIDGRVDLELIEYLQYLENVLGVKKIVWRFG